MTKRNRKPTHLSMEKMECRQLMAGDISYNSSTKTLTVSGESYNDQVLVSFAGNNVKVDLYAQRSNGSLDHSDRTKRISDVQKLVIIGLNGNDSAQLSQGVLNSGVTLNNLKVEFSGGNGNDSFINTTSAQSLAFGGEGDDYLYGGNVPDQLHGDGGNDRIYGNNGSDSLRGGFGNDILRGGNDGDTLYGDSGDDSLFGEQGDDSLFGSLGNDYVSGGDGNDILRGEDGNDTLLGEAGRDFLFGGLGHDNMLGGLDNDLMQGDAGNDTMNGGDGNDLMVGGADHDSMYGERGEDQIYGDDGNDFLDGGYDGNLDYLVGGNGADTFRAKTVRKIGFFEFTLEEDWIGDFGAGDTKVKRVL